MKFQKGDKIKIYKQGFRLLEHVGAVGVITDTRSYMKRYGKNIPTHYVVKFDCYKRDHIYMPSELEECCDKIGTA